MTRAAAKISDYASTSVTRKLVERARAAEIEPAAIEFLPGGGVRILSAAAFPAPPRDEFEALDQSGALG